VSRNREKPVDICSFPIFALVWRDKFMKELADILINCIPCSTWSIIVSQGDDKLGIPAPNEPGDIPFIEVS
jgi:hypothetical protein